MEYNVVNYLKVWIRKAFRELSVEMLTNVNKQFRKRVEACAGCNIEFRNHPCLQTENQ